MSATESWREISGERQLIPDVLHAEEGLGSQLPVMIRFKRALDSEIAQALDHNRRQETSDQGHETRLRGNRLAWFLRRHGNAPPRPYSRYTSWSMRHGEVILDSLQYARSLQNLSAVSWIRLAFKDGIIGEEIGWCVDGQLWRITGRGPNYPLR
jgi:hypothetical protein